MTTKAESVTEFTRRVKSLLEGGIQPSWIRGEISNLRAQSSGHFYFSLKDAGAQLPCVLFRGDAAKQTVQLKDGLQVIAFGNISVYELHGKYQLVVRAVVDDGVGKLQREFEALKQKLAAEGLFDPARKRPLPEMPRTIGFITSPSGAAVQDFLRILRRRDWRGRAIVLPAKVQGEGAADEMIAMLELVRELGIFDLLVIGRGGGSLEDLWAFNEEPLIRAVAASPVPIISAVGHEIDFTLCDFAADVRAETPSAAAELITSRFVGYVERVARSRSRLRLLSPEARVEQYHLRVDELSTRLNVALGSFVQKRRHNLTEIRLQFSRHSPVARLRLESGRLDGLRKRLSAASADSVLNRGFVIVRDEQGKPVQRRKGLKSGQKLTNQFSDGELRVRAD